MPEKELEENILSKLVKERREKLDYTQDELAEKLGVSRQTISKWENGYINNMSLEYVSDYASILRLPAIAFIYPETYLESEYIDEDYIDMAKKLQDNKIGINNIQQFIDLVKDIKLNIFKELR